MDVIMILNVIFNGIIAFGAAYSLCHIYREQVSSKMAQANLISCQIIKGGVMITNNSKMPIYNVAVSIIDSNYSNLKCNTRKIDSSYFTTSQYASILNPGSTKIDLAMKEPLSMHHKEMAVAFFMDCNGICWCKKSNGSLKKCRSVVGCCPEMSLPLNDDF